MDLQPLSCLGKNIMTRAETSQLNLLDDSGMGEYSRAVEGSASVGLSLGRLSIHTEVSTRITRSRPGVEGHARHPDRFRPVQFIVECECDPHEHLQQRQAP
jgi:hypothetical protein